MEPVKLGEGQAIEKKVNEKQRAVRNLVNLVRLTRRMAIKIYLYNSKDEIFTDGTFTDETLTVIKKEAQIVERALTMIKDDHDQGVEGVKDYVSS